MMAVLRRDVPYIGQGGALTKAGYDLFSTLFQENAALTVRLAAAEARLAGAAAVANAVGGATVDAQARAELVAIKGAMA